VEGCQTVNCWSDGVLGQGAEFFDHGVRVVGGVHGGAGDEDVGAGFGALFDGVG
jgi:hypothetical protein